MSNKVYKIQKYSAVLFSRFHETVRHVNMDLALLFSAEWFH